MARARPQVVASHSAPKMRRMKARRAVSYLRAALFLALTAGAATAALAGLAPDPATTHEAVVQVYGARTMGVKGIFGVHTWVAVKPTDAPSWTVYEIIGWGGGRAGPPPAAARPAPPAARVGRPGG